MPASEKLGHVANRAGSRLPESTPNNLYPTGDEQLHPHHGDGRSRVPALGECDGAAGLADDPRFREALARAPTTTRSSTTSSGSGRRSLPLETLEAILAQAGVPATRIFTIADIFADPHYHARGSIVHAPDDDLGSVAMAAVVPRLSATPGGVRHAGHAIGQDTRAVLRELLGMATQTIDALQAQRVISCARHHLRQFGDRVPPMMPTTKVRHADGRRAENDRCSDRRDAGRGASSARREAAPGDGRPREARAPRRRRRAQRARARRPPPRCRQLHRIRPLRRPPPIPQDRDRSPADGKIAGFGAIDGREVGRRLQRLHGDGRVERRRPTAARSRT